MRADPTDIAASAFAGMPERVGCGRGVIATERNGLGIVRIAARRGQAAKAAELLRMQFGVEAANRPRSARMGEVAVAGIGPNTWIATREDAGNAFAESLRPLLGHCASMTDQSDAYVILRLAGPKVRDTLAKLIPIDFHPRSFQVSDVAQTVCGYMTVMLWRLRDTAEGDPAFDVWAARSLAVSLHHALAQGAAEFGFERYTA
jgi:methylglutamate dehydrogenase subunit D